MDLLVDPLVLAMPLVSANQQELVEYIECLSHWSTEFIAAQHNFMFSEGCAFALDEAGCYPDIEEMKILWKNVNEVQIDCRDAFNACIKVLTNMPFLEDRIPELRDIAVDEASVRMCPDLLERQLEHVIPAFQETMGQIAYARSIIPESIAVNLRLLTYPIQGDSVAAIWANVLVESGERAIESNVQLIYQPDDLLDLINIWEENQRAIEWKARNMSVTIRLCPFKVSPEFNRSIIEKGQQKQSILLHTIFRKCVLLLTKQWTTIEAHELGRPQRQIGKWKAYRLHVTNSSPGWRLHYWRRGDEFYLMQLVQHDQDDIAVPTEFSDAEFCVS
jgi:predicted hydrocarbon binding protein